MTSAGTTPSKAALLVAVFVTGCASATSGDGNSQVYDAWRAARSGVEVQATGSIARVLGERSGRSGPHEGFLLHLTGSGGHGLTIRVEANLDIMGNFAVHGGDAAVVRGEYEYDARGGVLHWTHRDLRGRHPGGFVEINGRRYD